MNNIQTSSKVVHHPSFVSFYPRHRFAIFLKPLDAHDSYTLKMGERIITWLALLDQVKLKSNDF